MNKWRACAGSKVKVTRGTTKRRPIEHLSFTDYKRKKEITLSAETTHGTASTVNVELRLLADRLRAAANANVNFPNAFRL